jgi:hypothetical protein
VCLAEVVTQMKLSRRAVIVVLAGPACVLGAVAACSNGSHGGGDGMTVSCPVISTDCPTPPPSWAKDVQPIIQNYCVMCHMDGGSGESLVDLTSYANVFKYRSRELTQVYQCWMPNEDASPPPPPLSTAQRETIVAWLACNAPNN